MGSQDIIIIDGNEYTFEPGETILQVAERNKVEIPTLCYLKGASPTGACRICLVEVEGARTLVASCSMPASRNMVVRTNTQRVIEARRLNLELLLSSGQHNCLAQDRDLDTWTDFQVCSLLNKLHLDVCPAYGKCRLQDLAIKYQVKGTRFSPTLPKYEV
ncbi:MAG: 2Fe-2S iron-sulfur cluster-binding protein, partial [Desulfatiglandales bacterium]